MSRWLAIVGIGEDGATGLSPRAIAAIEAAPVVFGGARHLALAAPLVGARGRAWPSPFADGIAQVLALAGTPVCVLASGDPMFHGVGATLAARVPAAEMAVIPAPSCVSLAAARLGWGLADIGIVSVHGRPVSGLRRALAPGARLLVLTSGATDVAAIGALLADAGFAAAQVTLLEALGGPRERVRAVPPGAPPADIDPLNLVAIDCGPGPGATLAAGRDEADFAHDGQISRREVRAMILALLAPRRGETLWDVGAGSGSVAIEWLLADPSLRAVAIEPHADRAARIRANATRFGVPDLTVIEGASPAALSGLPTPHAIFVGGGATAPGALDAALAALPPGGRLVASAVTLETEALLLARRAALGGGMTRLSIERASPVGGMTGWRPAMPVTLWHWTRP